MAFDLSAIQAALRDERFATAAGRQANAAELDELVSEWTRS